MDIENLNNMTGGNDNVMLSVIVPVYTVEQEYLQECLESIDAQTFRDFELIIIDDGAPEATAKFLDEYVRKCSYAKVLHQSNAGVACARNKGLDICKGRYVTFIDADDTVTPDNFEKITSRAQRDNLDVLMWGLYRCFDDNKIEFSPYLSDIELFDDRRLLEVQYKCLVGILPSFTAPASADAAGSACAKLYRTDFIRSNNLKYVEGLKRAEDMLFNLMVFGKARRVGYIYEFFYNYRQLSSSATYMYRPNGIEVFTNTLMAMKEYLESEDRSREFMQIYYMRCMFFLLESMDMDYLNASNPNSFMARRKALREAALSEPYQEAVKMLDLFNKDLVIARKIPLILIRMRMFGVLMLFYKVYGLIR